MNNNFCRYLSNGYSFNVNTYNNSLQVKPCCLFKNSFKLDQNLSKNLARYHSVDTWIPECNTCRVLEEAGQQSLRQSSPNWIPDTTTHSHPVCLDINLDNSCNAACVICNEHSSSLWHKENKKLNITNSAIRIQPDLINDYVNQITQSFDLSHLTYIKFYGGEPLFTDTHIKFLEKIPNPENITIHYTTNGSIFPNKQTQEIWKKFKTIIFATSLDGVDNQFNYVRWPLPWHKVSANLIRLKNQNLHNVMFRVEYTANFLNAWYFDQLEQWVDTNLAYNNFGDKTEVNLHLCDGTFDLQRMPISLRQAIMEKYPKNHTIFNMIKNLKEPLSLKPFFAFVDVWDKQRELNWRQVFKDIEHFISGK